MATKFNRILVGVDDSADALLAFDYAIHQAKQDGAELVIISILENDEMNVQQAQAAGVTKVHAMIAEGEPGETIVKEVIPHVQPDLLIIGSLAKKGIAKHFGSQAAYMAKYAPISVLVIR